MIGLSILSCAIAWTTSVAAAPVLLPPTAEALASAMQGHALVLLGEVHDNAAQQALRAAALRLLLERGARPALAFEQFDRERQDDIDRARRERPRDADYLVAEAGEPGWNWALYKPFVALALEYGLPIVAANLSRSAAMKVATADASTAAPLPTPLLRAHEKEIVRGHCDLLPSEAVPGMARAQIARDRTLADLIEPHASRGVVLLTGNGHIRRDLGVPHWLSTDTASRAVSIALLERGEEGLDLAAYDAYVVTEAAARPDPCEALRKRMK